jgi:hypothetical protein
LITFAVAAASTTGTSAAVDLGDADGIIFLASALGTGGFIVDAESLAQNGPITQDASAGAVSLTALADFMDRLEQAPFPIAITQVRVRRRFGERNSFDVDDMVIATWEPAPEAPRNNNNGNRPAAEGSPR